MSTTSPQAEAAGQNAAWQAQLAKQLGGITLPELQKLLGGARTWVPNDPGSTGVQGGDDRPGGLGGHWEDHPGSLTTLLDSTHGGMSIDSDVAGATDKARSVLTSGYDQARRNSSEAISYSAMRGGERNSVGATNSAIGSAATTLERDRQAALSNLNFASASAGMQDYNKLLGLMGQGANSALTLSQGFSGASNAALSGLSTGTQAGSILGGASAGAGLGTAVYPGIGTAIGAVVGAGVGWATSP